MEPVCPEGLVAYLVHNSQV